MAGKYYIKGKDITTLCEPRVTAWGDTGKTKFTSYFAGDNTAIDGLHKGSSDLESRINVDYSADPAFYKYPGHTPFAGRGYLPTYLSSGASYVGAITSPGLWYVERTDSGIYFKAANSSSSDVTFGASAFRNGIVPHEILVIFVAGGGGGGGTGHYDSNGDSKGGEAVAIVGGAGGGGGVYAARVIVNDYKGNGTWQIGSGGAAGSDGSTSANSRGGDGGRGGNTGIYINGGDLIGCVAKGGSGGRAGTGNSNGTGSAGSGGSGGLGEGGYATRVSTMGGGKGNSYLTTNVSGTSGMLGVYVTEDTGQPMIDLCISKSNNAPTENTHSKCNAGAYFSGGCSWGYGAYRNSSGAFFAAGVGGGGGAGDIKSSGGSGAIYIYY